MRNDTSPGLFISAALIWSPVTNGFVIYEPVLSFYWMFNCQVWPVRPRTACN